MKSNYVDEVRLPSAVSWVDPTPSKASTPGSRLSYLVNSTSVIPSVMTLRVEVERTRVVIGTVVALAFVSRIVLVFYGGVEMEEIAVQEDARDYTSEGKLIDNYNSYSATVVSLFGRPIGVFIQLVVQLFVLRFPSTAILQPETPWHVRGGALCSAAALAYLVNNGLNALNAQLRPLEVQPVIPAADLSVSMSNNDSWSADEITNVSQVVSEASPGNPISNTVLRNLVLPRIWTQERVCTSAESTEPLPLDTVDFGFPTRSWHRQMLPNALAAQTLEVPVANTTPIDEALAKQLPMNASLASNLFLHGALMASRYYFPLFPSIFTNLLDAFDKKYTNIPANENRYDAISQVLNLAPTDNDGDDDEIPSRIIFLRKSRQMMQNQLTDSKNGSETGLKLEFAHVDISPTIHFDAVTFEVELPKDKPPARTFRCGPSSKTCMFERPQYGDIVGELDPPAQVNAFALCLNQIDGDEGICLRSGATKDWSIDCSQTSNTSLLIVRVGKRIVADTANGEPSTNGSYAFEAQNLRKIYSFTVGRLEWKVEDLSQVFSACHEVFSLSMSANPTGLWHWEKLHPSTVDAPEVTLARTKIVDLWKQHVLVTLNVLWRW